MRPAGKNPQAPSPVGGRLGAAGLRFTFLATDETIEAAEDKATPDIFCAPGAAAVRDMERRVGPGIASRTHTGRSTDGR